MKEKFDSEEYRDELAGKLQEIRSSNPEDIEASRAKARGYLEATQETEEYQEAKKIHTEKVEEKVAEHSRHSYELRKKKERERWEREAMEVTPQRAKEIMGSELFCGAEKIKEIWGIEVKKLPPVPFTEAVLEKAKQNNMFLEFIPPLDKKVSSAKDLGNIMTDQYVKWREKHFPKGNVPDKEYKINGPVKAGGPKMSWSDQGKFLDSLLERKEDVDSGWRLVQTIPLMGSFSVGETAKTEQQINIRRFVYDLLRDQLSLDKAANKLYYQLAEQKDAQSADDFKESAAEAYFRMVNQRRMGMRVTPAWTKSRFRARSDSYPSELFDYHGESSDQMFDLYLIKDSIGTVYPGALGDKLVKENMYRDHFEYRYPPTTIVIRGDWFKKLEQTSSINNPFEKHYY